MIFFEKISSERWHNSLKTQKIEIHIENQFMNRVKLGWNYISTVKMNIIYKEGINMLKKDPFFFLKNKPDLIL